MNKMQNIHGILRSHGFTMLEAMIALLIFSVGLLGLAGLQAGALQNNKTADLRSIAVIAAHDMAERIRANQRGVSNNYNSITPGTAPSKPNTDCTQSTCNTDQVADWDKYQWLTSLNTKLPSGTGSVSRTNNLRTSPITITVMWDEAHTGATGTGCDASKPNQDLKCYSMTFMP